jgi:AhpC/TSA antioxidant enzyme
VALAKSEFDRRGVSVVIISFAEPTRLVPYQEQHRWPFTILADPQREVYRAFELKRFSWFRVFSPPVLKLYFKLWRRGLTQEPYRGEDIYQSGGDFLLDSRGNVLYAYRSRDPADRPTPQKLLQEIDRVQPAQSR